MTDPGYSAASERWRQVEDKMLAGHYVRDGGKPFSVIDGIAQRAVGHAGFGLCECGAVSRRLYSDVARRRWHREHLDSLGIGPADVAKAVRALEEGR